MQFRTLTLVALVAAALCASTAVAQTSRPAQTAAAASAAALGSGDVAASRMSSAETRIIRRSTNPTATTRQSGAAAPPVEGFDTGRVVLSLGVVLGLIFALRWLSQRMFGKVVAGRASGAVQVLSRNVISPKQQLLVIRVGRRLVVVGDCGQQMNTLCEISDPEEMLALIGQIQGEKREATGTPFGAIFGRAGADFAEKENEPPRPRGVADEDDDPSTGPSGVDETRDELSGLMDKVRGMSRQFRRT